MPSAMSGGTCASATLEVAVSANSAAMQKKWCMVILPFNVASRYRSSGLRLHLACLQCSLRELKRFAVDYRWLINRFRQGDKFATLDRSEIGFVRMSLQGHEHAPKGRPPDGSNAPIAVIEQLPTAQ